MFDTGPAVSPAAVKVAGWIEWVSPDGRSAVIELASSDDPRSGWIWWVRNEELAPMATLALQPPRRGRRIGAIITQGQVHVGAEVVATEPGLAPKFPPLQSGPSK